MIPTALLRDTVSVEPRSGEGAAGTLYGTAVSYPARVEDARTLIRQTADAAVVSEAAVWLRPDAAVAVGDRLTLSGTVYRVLAVTPQRGLLRTEALRVELGRSAT